MKPGSVACNRLAFSIELCETADDYLGLSEGPITLVEVLPNEPVLILEVVRGLCPSWQDRELDPLLEPLAKVLTKGGMVGWLGLFSLRGD